MAVRNEAELERLFQADLIKELYAIFPGCLIIKNDANYLQGIPDLSIFWHNRWAMLECKASERSRHQPNQDYYVETLGEMSYAAFIYPENKDHILAELQRSFGASW